MGNKDVNAQYNLQGVRLWNQGDILGAEKSFSASIEQNPESDSGYGILTGFYLEQGELRKARLTLKRWKQKTSLQFKASYHMMWARLLSLEAIHEVPTPNPSYPPPAPPTHPRPLPRGERGEGNSQEGRGEC